MANTRTSPYHCEQCGREFKRAEHLRRHALNHQGEGRHECDLCHRKFQRRDVLSNHLKTHEVEPDAARTQPGRNKACTECARARERCSKDDVCLRCITRNLICLYPERRRGRKSISELSRPQSHIEAPSTEAPSTLHVEQLDQSPLSEAQLHLHAQEQSYVDYELSSAERMGHTPNNAENTWPIDYDHMSWATNVDAPINWLPVNIGTDLDYSSMLGSGLNFSFDSLPLQQPMNVPFPDAAETSTAASMGPIVLDSGQPQPHAPDSLTIRRTEFRDSDTIHGNRQSEKGSLYATSNDGARTSRSAKPHTTPSDTYDIQNTSPIPLSQEHVDNIGTGFGFLNLPDIYPNQLQDLGQIPDALQPSTYVAIHEQFINLCTISNVMFPQFSSSMFPSILHFNYFISLYFEYFHPTLPIVHRPSLDLNTNWHLATAISAIGSQYAPTNRVTKCSISLVEFLRRTIVVETENLDNSFTNLSLVQTMTLCQLGLVYSGYSKFQSASRNVHGRLINIIYTKGYLTQQTNLDPFDWQSWIFQETRKRLGYCIFMLDCMWHYQFGLNLSTFHSDATVSLPCDISVFEAESELKWASIVSKTETPSLRSALQTLYVKGTINPDISEFGRIILLHGIYQETCHVASYHMRPLSSCESTPRSGPRDYPDHSQSSEQSPNKFLPAITTFSRWRNATCDALDVIHWEANARVARQKGAEHPTILHLHLSRIIILTPYSHIRALAWSIASRADLALSEVPGTASDANAAQQAVIEWAQRDEHKARLAVLHAGSLFWHARRYSITAFYEPAAVFLATLVLWAYSSYTALASRIESHVQDNSPIRATDHSLNDQSQLPLQRSDSPTSSMIQSASDSTFILLDRPNDDEMVQLFVRAGHPSRMRAYMAGVGNLCSANGPIKICSEGKRVIEGTGSVWGCTAEYIRVLTSLEKAMVERYNC